MTGDPDLPGSEQERTSKSFRARITNL